MSESQRPHVTIGKGEDEESLASESTDQNQNDVPMAGPSTGKKPEGNLQVPLAARRSYFVEGTDLYKAKERKLRTALEVVRPMEKLDRRYLSPDDEVEVENELRLLDRCDPTGGSMYRPSRFHHARLNELLKRRQLTLNLHLTAKGIQGVDLPRWSSDGNVEAV